MRLDKLFSNLGLLSRSECKNAVKKGRITVNGLKTISPDMKIDPEKDEIYLDGEKIIAQQFVYYMFNKPSGVITANEDDKAPVVFDYIRDKRPDLSAVGRLDKDTTGLLLITNDGQMNHRLLSSKYHVEKTYQALIDGQLTEDDIKKLAGGMDIGDDKPTLPARVRIIDGKTAETLIDMKRHEVNKTENSLSEIRAVELTIIEGRYHQVKRMFAALKKPVLGLHRSGFGPLELDENLAPGEYRELTEEEISLLRS